MQGILLADPAEKGKGWPSDVLLSSSTAPAPHPTHSAPAPGPTEAEGSTAWCCNHSQFSLLPLSKNTPGSLTIASRRRQVWSSRAASGWDPPLRVSWNTAAASSKRFGPRLERGKFRYWGKGSGQGTSKCPLSQAGPQLLISLTLWYCGTLSLPRKCQCKPNPHHPTQIPPLPPMLDPVPAVPSRPCPGGRGPGASQAAG